MPPRDDLPLALTLSRAERRALEQLLTTTRDARLLRRAQALLWLAAHEDVTSVAARLRVSRQTIYNWLARFHQRAGHTLTERLADGARPGRPLTAEGQLDTWIEEVLDGDPRDFGYAATVWTAPLLRQYLEDTRRTSTSEDSVRRAIARLGFRWKRPRYRLAMRPATWRQAKGGYKEAWRDAPARCG